MAKRAQRNIKPQSQRYPNVRKEMKAWLDALVRNYDDSNPSLGEDSEFGKLEKARQSIEVWWYLYRYLMLWAQSHIVGYHWALKNPDSFHKLAAKLGIKDVSEDSHILEYIGLVHVFNFVNEDDPFQNAVFDALEKSGDWHLDNETLRLVIRELTVSGSPESSFWRFPLQSALFALNMGEALGICVPSPGKKQGSPYNMRYWRRLALCHVHFMIGQGFKKHRALETVGNALGQSVETLRTWEKAFHTDEDAEMSFFESHVAGQFREDLSKFAPLQKGCFVEDFWKKRHRNQPLSVRAKQQLKSLESNPLEVVRAGLRASREKSRKVVSKRPLPAPKK